TDTSTLSLHDALPICEPQPLEVGVVVTESRIVGVGVDAVGVRMPDLHGSTLDPLSVGSHHRAAQLQHLTGGGFAVPVDDQVGVRSEEHTSELQSRANL